MRKLVLSLLLSLSMACASAHPTPESWSTGRMLTAMQLSGGVRPQGSYMVDGDSHKGLIAPLQQFVERRQGFKVVVSAEPHWDCGGCLGYTHFTDKILWVSTGQGLNAQFATLLHEAGHTIISYPGRDRMTVVDEIIVEAAAYQAAAKLGLNTQQASFNYMSQYPLALRDAVFDHYGLDIDKLTALLVRAVQRGE
jgi:hypothetical protein